MLGNALVFVAIIAIAVATAVSSTYAAARATLHRTAERYVAVGYANALADVRNALATQIATGQYNAGALPAFTPSPPQPVCPASSGACSFYATETVTLSAASAQANNLEADGHVNEGRVSAHIAVTILAPDRTALAARMENVTLRTSNTPPYVAIGGARDGSVDGVATDGTDTDDGGLPPGTATSACNVQTIDETVVRAEYYNDATGKCMDASTWQSKPAALSAPAPWSP